MSAHLVRQSPCMMRTWILLLALAGCTRPAPATPPPAPRAAPAPAPTPPPAPRAAPAPAPTPVTPSVTFRPLPPPLEGPGRACAAPECNVIRDAASAPVEVRDIAASVDFNQFVLVAVKRSRRFADRVTA